MDKLGIFKLLNSLFNFYQEKNNENSNKTSDFSLANLPFFNQDNKNNNQNRPVNPTKTQSCPPPLQSQMLNTISSHESFVNRVKKRYK